MTETSSINDTTNEDNLPTCDMCHEPMRHGTYCAWLTGLGFEVEGTVCPDCVAECGDELAPIDAETGEELTP